VEYAIHNVLTGHAFGLFYCLPDDALSMALYGFSSSRLDVGDFPEGDIIERIKENICMGNAAHIDEGNGPFDYLIWGYRDGGDTLLGYKFEHGNDMLNCSFDFDSPVEFGHLRGSFSDTGLYRPNGEKPGGVTFIGPDGERLGHGAIFAKALAEGCRMLTQIEPPRAMDFGRVHFGYGKAIYDEWARQIELAEREGREEYYYVSPFFPHFIALYENRLHLLRFLIYLDGRDDLACPAGGAPLKKAIGLCEKLKGITREAAAVTVEGDWNPLKDAPNHERRVFLLDALKKSHALDLEIAGQMRLHIGAHGFE
jgi:hypothetical protein